MWTNTCCSHPLGIPGETGSNLPDSVDGVKRAAQRKLDHELGIKKEQVPFEDFRFLTRIHYKAPSNGKWGEHESQYTLHDRSLVISTNKHDAVDYILFIKANVNLDINLNEVRDTKYVTQDELKALFKDPTLKFTPWFKLICESMLFEWWSHLDSGLEKYTDEQEIRRM
jgi:isopentenyl-diphosphate delta-isomerase